MKTLPVAYLHECLTYNPETGEMFWKPRPEKHFASPRGWRVFQSKLAGVRAGTVSKTTGYSVINFGAGNLFGAHRVAFAMAYGRWPEKHIDHRNGIRSDNRLENLRECDPSDNQCNRTAQSNSSSGLKGAHRHAPGVWRARIKKGKKLIDLGLFKSPEAAHAAYKAAVPEMHGEFARTD